MPQAFHLHARAVDVRPLEDCFLAIFNREESDPRRYYELVRLAISDPAPISANTAAVGRAGKLRLFRTTAQSGGTAISVVKHDTGSASLPSQVVAVNNPDSVTTTGAAIRGVADAPTYSIATNNGMAARNFGGTLLSYDKSHNADILRAGCGTGVCEPIVLREGEGVALTQQEAGVPHSMAIACQVTDLSTGATYTVRARSLCSDPIIGAGIWGLFNGSGSGVVLQVRVVILPMDGETNLPMTTRLAKISGLDLGADALTPFAADTANSVPASLACFTGPTRARLVGGWNQDWQYGISATSIPLAEQQNAGVFTRKTYSKDFPAIGSSINQTMQRSGMDDIVVFRAKAGSGIRINPGEGLGLLAGRGGVLDFSTFHTYNLEATILHYPPDLGAAVYPDEGDVDSGITYGPTGTDYTGTLTLPTEAQVESGVGFGANGTEFTGSFAGGGGGTGTAFIRRR